MIQTTLEAPWYTFRKMVNALFERDASIVVGDIYEAKDGEPFDYAFDIEVTDHEKAMALERMMPSIKTFGAVTLAIFIFDEENNELQNGTEVFEKIFKDNPIVKDYKNVTDRAGVLHSFVRFKPEVIQFFDDDMTDYNGNWSGLAEDIAREVFCLTSGGLNFCTAAVEEDANGVDLNKPLGEWP